MNVESINAYVERYRDEAIQFLQELLQTPSPTGEELVVSEVTAKWMESEGLQVERHALDPLRPNLLAYWIGKSEEPKFMFNGHYDVFPPVDDPRAPNPWSGEIKDGNIYGRGSVDMKGGLAAGIMAVKLLKRSGFMPNGTIIISCDADEEQGGEFGSKYLISKGLLKADFGISMEASEDLVIVDSDGRIAYSVTYKSDSWHAGTRSEQDNALQKAVKAIDALNNYDATLKRERYFSAKDGGAILSITSIKAGTVSNMNPDTCTFTIDRRYTKGETPESSTRELRQILDGLKADDPEMDYDLEIPIISPRLAMDEKAPLIDSIIDTYNEFTGKTIRRGRRCGGGDTSKITDAYGYPLPQFGPGKFDQLCREDEHLEIDDYLLFIKMYMGIVVKVMGNVCN